MPLQLIETTISGTSILIRYADSPDKAQAKHWIEFCVPLSELIDPATASDPLQPLEGQYFGSIQVAALRYARNALTDETQAISRLEGRRS
jgi:hypothetical protein